MNADRLKWIAGLFGFVAGLMICSSALFAAGDKLKIAVVDIGKVFDEYERTKKIDVEFQKEGRTKQEARDAIIHDIRKLRDEQGLLSEGARQKKQEAIDKRTKDLEAFDEETRKALSDKRNEAVKGIFQDIDNTMKQYGERKGYDLILSERALLYSNKAYDVTADILTEVNQKYKKENK